MSVIAKVLDGKPACTSLYSCESELASLSLTQEQGNLKKGVQIVNDCYGRNWMVLAESDSTRLEFTVHFPSQARKKALSALILKITVGGEVTERVLKKDRTKIKFVRTLKTQGISVKV